MATSTFSAKITNLVGGTIDDDACDDWMTEGAKEIINQLPVNLLRLCTSNTTFTSQAAGSESSGSGNLLNTGKVLNVFAGNFACRFISNLDKYKAEDSDNVLYATATDPAYYIERSLINVLPAGISTSRYEEVQYPTVDISSDNAIALFPDEAEHLVVLYAAMRQLLQYQSTMSASWNDDITTALTAVNTAADDIKAEIVLANAEVDLEDMEKASGYLATAQAYIAEAGGYIAEVSSRLQSDSAKYQWYGDQYAKLSAEYARGLAAVKGTTEGGGA